MCATAAPDPDTRDRLAAAVICAAVTIALAASPALAQVATLGSPPPEAEASAAPAEGLSEQEAMLAYAGCMRDNGIEVSDPAFDAAGNFVGGLEFAGGKDGGPKDAKGGEFVAATGACAAFLVAFKPPADPALEAEQTEAALRFAVCIREQGLDWPDSAPDGSEFGGADIKVDKESPEYRVAFEACDEVLASEQEDGSEK